MKAFCEKYVTYFIAVLLIILLYRMYIHENKIQRIDNGIGVVVSQNREIIEKLNQPLILDR